MSIQFSLAKCKTKAAYSSKLRQGGKLNLKRIKEQFETLLETPILLVIRVENLEIIVHSHGELLFKNSAEVQLMEKVAERIYLSGLEKNSAPDQI